MKDLFEKQPKKEKLLAWLLSRNWTKSHDVVQWGMDNFHIRADRDAQELAEEGHIRRMTDQEKADIAFFGKEGVWVPCQK